MSDSKYFLEQILESSKASNLTLGLEKFLELADELSSNDWDDIYATLAKMRENAREKNDTDALEQISASTKVAHQIQDLSEVISELSSKDLRNLERTLTLMTGTPLFVAVGMLINAAFAKPSENTQNIFKHVPRTIDLIEWIRNLIQFSKTLHELTPSELEEVKKSLAQMDDNSFCNAV